MSQYQDYVADLVGFIDGEGALFHVTDESNLSSIEEHGLLSKKEAEDKGIVPKYPGGDGLTRALDEKYGLWDYVFLGFNTAGVMPAHKDEKHLRRPRTLYVDPQILYRSDVMIALGRTNQRWTETFDVRCAVRKMDQDVFIAMITGSLNWDAMDIAMRRRAHQVFSYEILVPKRVPPEDIYTELK
jgi:hypothetical protein